MPLERVKTALERFLGQGEGVCVGRGLKTILEASRGLPERLPMKQREFIDPLPSVKPLRVYP